MTRLITDPGTFAADALAGFVAAHRRWVRPVDGGVVRAAPLAPGRMAVVSGGVSGHYPAFMGLVGKGLLAGAACGNIFASPSSGQVVRVARAAARGAGILLTFGNYAGDRLQFGLAAERLRSEGHAVRLLPVSDDVASGPAEAPERRRGIAGGLVVYKVAGAAAEAGLPLDAVERLARRANASIRSLGVAFSGCTLPGAAEPLFQVPRGRMAVGLGLHGEPGLEEVPLTDAAGLARRLVDALLADGPEPIEARPPRVVAILNGLGSFKYEELFALYKAVAERLAERLAERGVTVADCECGELATSLDMAGVSLTLFWLDDELEGWWRAPAATPAYRRSVPAAALAAAPAEGLHPEAPALVAPPESPAPLRPATAAQREASHRLAEGLLRIQAELRLREQELGALDAVAGDGDHGLGMVLGVTGAVGAARQALERQAGLPQALLEAGEAWSEQAGGSSGALWGIGLAAAGNALESEASPDLRGVSAAVDAALAAIEALGGAQAGDKTLVDALQPFARRLRGGISRGEALDQAWRAAAAEAGEAADATASLVPRLGRARSHGSRSLGHPDPGAVSFARAAAAAVPAPGE